MMTKLDSKCLTMCSAVIRAIGSPLWQNRFLPSKRSANSSRGLGLNKAAIFRWDMSVHGLATRGARMTRIVERRSDLPDSGLVVNLKVYRDPAAGDAVYGFVGWIERDKATFVGADFNRPVRDAHFHALALCNKHQAALLVDDPLGLFPPRERPRAFSATDSE
jgi:hypothetical protein